MRRSDQGDIPIQGGQSTTGESHKYPGTCKAASRDKAVILLWHAITFLGDSH